MGWNVVKLVLLKLLIFSSYLIVVSLRYLVHLIAMLVIVKASFAGVVNKGLVDASFASLPECLLAAVNATNKRFLPSMGEIMLYQILLQSKTFIALFALEVLLDFVFFHVSLKAILSFETTFATKDVAQEPFIYVLH